MIRFIITLTLGIHILALGALADNTPDEARREIDKLKQFIKQQTAETEKRIIDKKKHAIRALERLEKQIDNEFASNLIKLQLVKYRKEITKAEAILGKKSPAHDDGDDHSKVAEARKIIDFNKSYFYRHPMEKYKKEVGELKFFTNGKVNCYHRLKNQVKMFKKWRWSMDGIRIKITADHSHGPIYITKKSPREIYLDWKGIINKKNVAKQK